MGYLVTRCVFYNLVTRVPRVVDASFAIDLRILSTLFEFLDTFSSIPSDLISRISLFARLSSDLETLMHSPRCRRQRRFWLSY